MSADTNSSPLQSLANGLNSLVKAVGHHNAGQEHDASAQAAEDPSVAAAHTVGKWARRGLAVISLIEAGKHIGNAARAARRTKPS